MKKIFFMSAFVLFIAAIATSCKSEQEKQTEKWLQENSETAQSIATAKAMGIASKEKISITKWNSTPIDTVTSGDIAREFDLYYAEQGAIFNLNMATSKYETLTEWASLDYMAGEMGRLREEAENYTKIANDALAKVDSIKAFIESEDGKKPLYYVYECTMNLSYTQPTSGEKIAGDTNCYSYVSISTGNVAKVVDNGKPYKLDVSNLTEK